MSQSILNAQEALKNALKNQGPYENDVTFEGIPGLINSWNNCTKNPGHRNFIPVRDFRTGHLPDPFQDELVTEIVHGMADVTVLLDIKYVSERRPDQTSDGEDYPFNEYKGQELARSATGWIARARKKFESGEECPCLACAPLSSHQRVRPYGKVIVWTATHNIYDVSEAVKTRIGVFHQTDYDDNGGGEVVIDYLYPYGIFAKDDLGDWCGVKCITHDIQLWDRIRDRYRNFNDLMKRVDERFRNVEENLAVIVSHPHGQSARVSVGQWTHRDNMSHNEDFIQCRYSYTAPTCPGSSGAPVFIAGRMARGMYLAHPHSRVGDNSQCGFSSYGINY
ncbi:hypothetical protein Btru_053811 [Bulinus truncatus]|nr:hypothetical protein Btru_053811 [Bulinus truncatus]